MALFCFVLDLRSLSPPVLRDLKQSLLQLANYYAISSTKSTSCLDGTQSDSKPLPDRIGLCYIVRNRITCSNELKIAYNPQGKFSLRDLHRSISNLPLDAFCPESNDSGAFCIDLKLVDVLSEKSVYTWGSQDKNVERKVILISSLVGALDSITMSALTDAAERCILVQFILLEQTSTYLGDNSENVNQFLKQIESLKNCSFHTCVPGLQVLCGLAKKWFQELQDDKEVTLQAHFIFKTSLVSTLNQISCNLCASFNPIVDQLSYCQTCRCHGIPLDHSSMKQTKKSSSCPVTNDNLGALDIIQNSVRVGEQTILHMPSFQDSPELKKVSSIDFDVIQRANLGSLSEGLIMGSTYFVTPTFHHSDESDKSELNCQLFKVVCRVLNSLDQGLVCSSTCNIETATKTSLRFYYILLPSDKGLMLLRRLSASEEFLPIPAYSQLGSSSIVEEIESAVQASLLKVEVSDYNPIHHERGFHKKLNMHVKESLQFGAIFLKTKEETSTSDSDQQNSEASKTVTVDEPPQSDAKQGEKRTSPSLAEEWEQLIVTELGTVSSPKSISTSKLDQPFPSPSQDARQLDERTSRILERLEVPRQLKRKAHSPTFSCNFSADVCGPAKRPLIPYRPTGSEEQGPVSSLPIKPNFQRLKRKK